MPCRQKFSVLKLKKILSHTDPDLGEATEQFKMEVSQQIDV